MKIQFDVALSVMFEIPETHRHYDDSEEKTVWLMVRCSGDIGCNLEDFDIFEVSSYTGKTVPKPLDDSLVPYIPMKGSMKWLHRFLKNFILRPLKLLNMTRPIWVDPNILTERLGLTIKISE